MVVCVFFLEDGTVEVISPLRPDDADDAPPVLADFHVLHTLNHYEALILDPEPDFLPPLNEHPNRHFPRPRDSDDDESDDEFHLPPPSKRRMALSELVNSSPSSDIDSEPASSSEVPPRRQCDPGPGSASLPTSTYSRYSFEEGFALLLDAFDNRADLEAWAAYNAERVTAVLNEAPSLSKPGTVVLLDIPTDTEQASVLSDRWGVFKDQTPGRGKGPDPIHPDRREFFCHRRLFTHKYNKELKRALWWLSRRDGSGKLQFTGLALLQYTGQVNFDELRPHGNSKKCSSVYNRLSPSVRNQALEQLQTTVSTAFLRGNPELARRISHGQVRTLRQKALNEKKKLFVIVISITFVLVSMLLFQI